MSEIYCQKCGNTVQPTDLFCRKCGSLLGSTTFSSEPSAGVSAKQFTLPADQPISIITKDDLENIWEKWDKYKRPDGLRYKAPEIIELPYLKILDLIFLLGRTNPQVASTQEDKLGKIISPSFLLCCYIGYELTSGGIIGGDCTPYLRKATEPIRSLLLYVLDILVVDGIISGNEGQSKALEIVNITNQAADKACILGVYNYPGVREQLKVVKNEKPPPLASTPPISIREPVQKPAQRYGAIQKSSPAKEPKKSSSSWLIIIVILLIVFGVILVPIIAPDWANEKPGDLLLFGGSFMVIGVIAWLLEWSGKVRFVGRGSCCLFFPLVGLIVFLYGLFSFFIH